MWVGGGVGAGAVVEVVVVVGGGGVVGVVVVVGGGVVVVLDVVVGVVVAGAVVVGVVEAGGVVVVVVVGAGVVVGAVLVGILREGRCDAIRASGAFVFEWHRLLCPARLWQRATDRRALSVETVAVLGGAANA